MKKKYLHLFQKELKLESIEKAKQLREKILNRDDKVSQEQRQLLVKFLTN